MNLYHNNSNGLVIYNNEANILYFIRNNIILWLILLKQFKAIEYVCDIQINKTKKIPNDDFYIETIKYQQN